MNQTSTSLVLSGSVSICHCGLVHLSTSALDRKATRARWPGRQSAFDQ